MRGARIPAGRTSASTRSRISCAALFVNVTAITERGGTPSMPSRYAIRCAMTLVLPLPAPASTSTGPLVVVTASRWGAFRGASSDSAVTSERNMGTYDTTATAASWGWGNAEGRVREGTRPSNDGLALRPANVGGLKALRAAGHLEFDLIALGQALEALSLD